jgi:hypothetical protein
MNGPASQKAEIGAKGESRLEGQGQSIKSDWKALENIE